MQIKCDDFVMKKLIYADDSEDNEEADKSHIQGYWKLKSGFLLLLFSDLYTCNLGNRLVHL